MEQNVDLSGNNTRKKKENLAEMKMWRWLCGKTRKKRIRNGRIQEHLRAVSIGDELRETRL